MPTAKSLLLCAGTFVIMPGAALAHGSVAPLPDRAAAADFPIVSGQELFPVLALVAQTDDGTPARFTWSATKTQDGIIFDGEAATAAIKSSLVSHAGAGAVDHMTVGKGAPDNFVTISGMALDALMGLETGRVAYTGSSWTMGGFAPSQEARDAILANLGDQVALDQWVVAVGVAAPDMAVPESAAVPAEQPAEPEMPAIAAEPFKWSIAKAETGNITIDGRVPTEALKSHLDAEAGSEVIDNSEVGGTAPDDFASISQAAVAAISALDKGRIAYTGYGWTFGGFAPDHATIDAVLDDLGAVTDLHQWLVFIEVTPAPVEEEATVPAEEAAVPVEEEQPTPAEPQKTVIPPGVQFNALKSDGLVTLSGDVSSEVFGRYASLLANGAATGALSVADSLNYKFNDSAEAGLTALQSLESGLLAFENGGWSLIGDAIGAGNADAAKALIAALPDGTGWTIDIAVTPVFEVCADAVEQFSNSHTILFAPGSSRLAGDSANALVALAGELKRCPAADLYVEGYTDSDGPADTNMALSVARSESVIAQLVDMGLDETRLYAVGYGETLPLASNDTAAGKAQNRRIVFRLVKE